MNDPIEILSSCEEDDGDIIEILSDHITPKPAKIQHVKEKHKDDLYVSLLSSPIVIESTPTVMRSLIAPVTAKNPTNLLYDIVNMGFSSDCSDDEEVSKENKKKRKSDILDNGAETITKKRTLEPEKKQPLNNLFSNKLFVSEDETNDSIISASKEDIRIVSPVRTTSRMKPNAANSSILEADTEKRYIDKRKDEELILAEHNILLSSSPDYNKFNNDFTNSSPIGDIKISKFSKPAISKNLLDDIDEKKREYVRPERVYKDTSSNPFLNMLQKDDIKTKNKLERIGKYLDEKKVSAKSTKLSSSSISLSKTDLAKSNSLKESTNTAKLSPSPISRSKTDIPPSLKEPSQTSSKMTTTTIAKRSQTFDSTKKRISKEERELLKINKEAAKKSKKLYQELNKSKRTKDELLEEMILEVPNDIVKMFETVKDFKNEITPIQIKAVDSNDNFIKWLRKSDSKYNTEKDIFEPVNFHIIHETKLCYIYTAKEFIQDIKNGEDGTTIVEKFQSIRRLNKSKFDNIIILIIGIDAYFAKLKNQENREFQARVRNNLEPESTNNATGTQKKRNTKKTQNSDISISIEEIESTIAQLKVNGFRIFPTKNVLDAILWIKSFTYTISSARYDKYERNPDLAQIGQIKSGQDQKDTYSKMLQHFKLMTSLKAERIIDRYPTIRELFTGIRSGRSMVDHNGKNIMSGNIEIGLKKLFTTYNENELLRDN